MISADPWEHLLGMGLGVVLANQMVKWDAKAQEDLDKLLAKAKEANERRYFGTSFIFLLFPFSYYDFCFHFFPLSFCWVL